MSIQTAVLEIVRDLPPGTHKIYLRTPDGIAEWSIGATIPAGEMYAQYVPVPEPKAKKVSAKKNKRASMSQETEVMEALGGRRQAGSGARGHLKGDGRVRDKYRVEIKFTRKDSYRVTRDELGKIRGECAGMEQPLFIIGFKDPETGGNEDRWVLLPFHHFQKLDKAHAAGNDR